MNEHDYRHFATTLDRLLAGRSSNHIEIDGYMPLVVEEIGMSGHARFVALAHTAEPVSFRNDFTATFSEVYSYDASGQPTGVDRRQQSDLCSFVRLWFRNLRDQGFLDADARQV